MAVGDERRLSFARLSAAGDVLDSVSAGPPIQARRWYFAAASWDAAAMVTLVAAARDPRRPGADPGDGGRHDLGGPLAAARVIMRRGCGPIDGRPLRCFNGKIDTPRVFTGSLSPAARQALAADADAARVGGLRHEWRLGPEAALPPHRVRDAGPGRRDGVLVNMPTLGVTGRNWRAATESFAADPGQYRAAHFHADDLSDAGWASRPELRGARRVAERRLRDQAAGRRARGHGAADRERGRSRARHPGAGLVLGGPRPRCCCPPSATSPTRTSTPRGSARSRRRSAERARSS